MPTSDSRERSRKIRDLTRDLDRSISIASSTGSNHGTITADLSVRSRSPSVFEHSLASLNYSELDPNDSELFESTNHFKFTPANKLPELRDTAKKYGRWSPRRERTPIVNTSVMNEAFKDFSGTVPEPQNTFTLELPRGSFRNRFQPSPTPVSGDDNSYLGASLKVPMPAEQNKENTPLPKSHSAQRSLKGSPTKGSPYISYASRTVHGERRTLAELHAQVTDGSENSLLLNERPSTLNVTSKTSRFAPQSTTSAPSSQVPQASQNPTTRPQSREPPTIASAAPIHLQTREYSVSGTPVRTHPRESFTPTAPFQNQSRKSSDKINTQSQQSSAVPHTVPLQERRASAFSAQLPAQLPKITTTFAPGQSQVYKASPTEILMQVPFRRHSQPESSSLVTPRPALQPGLAAQLPRTRGMRSNSDPTLPTQTFVMPAECLDKTKPIEKHIPVLVRDGKVELPPQRRRRNAIDGIVIPDDEEELYRMIIGLHDTIDELGRAKSQLAMASNQLTEANKNLTEANGSLMSKVIELRQSDSVLTAENDRLKAEAESLKAEIATLKTAALQAYQTPEHKTPSNEGHYDTTQQSIRVSEEATQEVTQRSDFTQRSVTERSRLPSPQLQSPEKGHPELEQTQNMTSAYILEDLRPVLSNQARQVLQNICEHNCKNCKICVRVATFHDKPLSKRAKQTVRVARPVPISKRAPENENYEDDNTMRPSRAPGIALATVIHGLEEEVAHLKIQHTKTVQVFHELDRSVKRAQRIDLVDQLKALQTMIDLKADQIYNLYDVLEGQVATGMTMDESGVDITVISEKIDDEELPWEQILDEA